MLYYVIPLCLAIMTAALVLTLLRLIKGPDLPDRILALDTLYINAIALIVLFGIWLASDLQTANWHPDDERWAAARASLIGLSTRHRFPDILRAVIEGLGLSARDCYAAMGDMPAELRLTGGAARSTALRRVLGAAVGAPTRVSSREEAGAAGAAMMAAVANGVYPDMAACIADWVTPALGPAEPADPDLTALYARRYPAYRMARLALEPVWDGLSTV